MSYEGSDTIQRDARTDNGVEIDALYLMWSSASRAAIKSVPPDKAMSVPCVLIDGNTYVFSGTDTKGMLIFEEI